MKEHQCYPANINPTETPQLLLRDLNLRMGTQEALEPSPAVEEPLLSHGFSEKTQRLVGKEQSVKAGGLTANQLYDLEQITSCSAFHFPSDKIRVLDHVISKSLLGLSSFQKRTLGK